MLHKNEPLGWQALKNAKDSGLLFSWKRNMKSQYFHENVVLLALFSQGFFVQWYSKKNSSCNFKTLNPSEGQKYFLKNPGANWLKYYYYMRKS